jgi:small-conductance mechanosensitive channel
MRFSFVRSRAESRTRRFARRSAACLFVLALIAGAILGPALVICGSASADDSGSQSVLQFLGLTIRWYHLIASQQAAATDPGDLVRVNQDREVADRVVQLAFEYARAASQSADQQSGQASANGAGNDASTGSQAQRLEELSSKLNDDVQNLQGEVASLRLSLQSATGAKRQQLQGALAETQSELQLAEARRDAIQNMSEFVSGTNSYGAETTGLRAQVEQLARSVPAADTAPRSRAEQSGSAADSFSETPLPATQRVQPNGIWAVSEDLIELYRERSSLGDAIKLTRQLDESCVNLRAPYLGVLKQMSQQGDQIAKQADAANPSAYAQEKKQLDALTAQFKTSASQSLPLSEMDILLNLCQRNLADWHSDVDGQFSGDLRSLLFRLGALAAVLFFVFGIAEIWRRAIFRYVHDGRRLHVSLLVRKIVLTFAIVGVVFFTFAGEIGSVATFAGLLTAGVAVALQNVILSVAGYFFLIGKYGIRVGDQVEIAGVVGEVVDVGLVRLHLMELGKGGVPDPSGRVVAFPNSVVFQSNAGLFRQIPGTSFSWREITLTFAAENDWNQVKERVGQAVDAAYAAYKEEIEQQSSAIRKMFAVTSMATLQPKIHWSAGLSRMEATIRYPVSRQAPADADHQFMQTLMESLGREPAIKFAASSAATPQVTSEAPA